MTHMKSDDRNRDLAYEARHLEGAGMDDWHAHLAEGFEPRPWRIEGTLVAALVLMGGALIFVLAIIGLLKMLFPGVCA